MPAKTPPTKAKSILRLILILLSLIFPLILLVVGLILFIRTNPPSPTAPAMETLPAGINPSEILNQKGQYSGENLIVTGRISLEPIVCEKKSCPAEDPCCGCPPDRHLDISDSQSVLASDTQSRLRLVDANGQALCQRATTSCDYNCPGWTDSAIYDVTGTFYAQPPPPGWKMSLEFYFKVADKELAKTTTRTDIFFNFFNEIKAQINSLITSGSYVLP